MEPLDLTSHPPRSCYAKLDGLMVMPRTIDKLRALLPGGNPGVYFINGKIMGISGYLLKRLGIDEGDLQAVVAKAESEDEVAAWVRERTDPSQYAMLSSILAHVEPRHAEDPEYFRSLYTDTLTARPDLTRIVDILDVDDARMFGDTTATRGEAEQLSEPEQRSAPEQRSEPEEISAPAAETTPPETDTEETTAKRKRAEEAWNALVAARASRDIVEGTVRSAVKGGYIVALGPFRGFLPASQSRLGGTPPEKAAGKAVPLIVIDVDDSKKRVVVSHRQALDTQRRASRASLLASLTVGSVHSASVVRLADFGAFVDLGGIDALVPIGELALERIEKPADAVNVGDRFDVRVIRTDAAGKRIAVSRKALLADPWRDHASLLQRGKVVNGTVVANATELQIEIAPGIVGTVSENEATPADYEIGEAVEVSIRSADFQRRRLRLSTMHAAQSFSSTSFAPLGDELKV